ncbi:MAG: methyltransferase domain-containing protein [Tatlockia sp.]|jgi:O-antigen chain-terminating methyltransferase
MKKDFYKAFEEKFRGNQATIKQRLHCYLPFIRPMKSLYPNGSIIDLGCGRGEWLQLLREQGFNAQGVELDEDMIATCRESNLAVTYANAVSYLQSLPSQSQIIITAFHLAEHLSFDDLQTLVEESLRVLRPAGLLILETPNPENIHVAGYTFYLDPTHLRPLPPELLAFLPEYYGFEKVKILRLQEAPGLLDKKLVLMDVLQGVSPDYAVVAQKATALPMDCPDEGAFSTEYGISLEYLAKTYNQQLEAQVVKAEHTVLQVENKVKEIESTANRAERKAVDAELVAEGAKLQAQETHSREQHIESRLKEIEFTARHAEIKANEAELMAEGAKTQAQETHSREQHIESKLKEIELTARHAEMKASEAELMAEGAKNQAQEAEFREQHIEHRLKDVESRACQAESKASEAEQKADNAKLQAQETQSREHQLENMLKAVEFTARHAETKANEVELIAESAKLQAQETQSREHQLENMLKAVEFTARHAEIKANEAELIAEGANLQAQETQSREEQIENRLKELEFTARHAELKASEAALLAEHAELQIQEAKARELQSEIKIKGMEYKMEQLISLSNSLEATKARNQELDSLVHQKSHELNSIQSKIAELHAHSDWLQNVIQEQQWKSQQVEQRAFTAEEQLGQLLQSPSWRFTAPLRLLGNNSKSLFEFVKSSPKKIAHGLKLFAAHSMLYIKKRPKLRRMLLLVMNRYPKLKEHSAGVIADAKRVTGGSEIKRTPRLDPIDYLNHRAKKIHYQLKVAAEHCQKDLQ